MIDTKLVTEIALGVILGVGALKGIGVVAKAVIGCGFLVFQRLRS